jgi:serine/threonine protein kinase
MPTPLPVKSPASSKPEVVPSAAGGDDRRMVPSGMSVKLEPPDPAQTGVLEPGTIIAERYRVDSLLGEGGMGKVYAAEHVHMRKQVAIKVLHPEMSTTPEVVARFEREAVAAGKIAHPNVAAATDFGRLENSSFFLVLEYVAGTDLRARINEGALSPERAVHIVRQITSAVGAAHAAGVVHRDLKPENIMLVEREGDPDFVKVLDFGIAKIDSIGILGDPASTASGPSSAQPLTKMGAVFGTPDYMSPEQALGQPIDARSDLYSIGVIFFELVAGQRPFKGGAVTLMRAHVLDAVPTLPPELVDTLGPQFNLVIQKLLQKSANERYSSATELLQALDDLYSEPPIETAAEPPLGTRPTAIDLNPGPKSLPAPALTDSSAAFIPVPTRRRRAFGPLSWLIIVGLGGAGLYWLAVSPTPVPKDLSNLLTPTPASPHPSAVASEAPVESTASLPQAAPPTLDSAFAPQAIDSSGQSETDEIATAPDDSTPQLASSAAPHHGARVTQTRPATKPMHKTNKPQPAPRHPFIPPPSTWFKTP